MNKSFIHQTPKPLKAVNQWKQPLALSIFNSVNAKHVEYGSISFSCFILNLYIIFPWQLELNFDVHCTPPPCPSDTPMDQQPIKHHGLPNVFSNVFSHFLKRFTNIFIPGQINPLRNVPNWIKMSLEFFGSVWKLLNY